jgi:hypothetical protein
MVDVIKLISEYLTARMIASLLVKVHAVHRKERRVVICVRVVCFLIRRELPQSRWSLRLGDNRDGIVRARGPNPTA